MSQDLHLEKKALGSVLTMSNKNIDRLASGSFFFLAFCQVVPRVGVDQSLLIFSNLLPLVSLTGECNLP